MILGFDLHGERGNRHHVGEIWRGRALPQLPSVNLARERKGLLESSCEEWHFCISLTHQKWQRSRPAQFVP